MSGNRIYVITTDFRVFGRVEAYLSTYQFDVIDSSISVKSDGKVHATFEVSRRKSQISFDVMPTSEILNCFFSLKCMNVKQSDALHAISKLMRSEKVVIQCEHGRFLEPLAVEKIDTATEVDCEKPFRIQSIEISDCRIQVTVIGEGRRTIYFSVKDRAIMARIAQAPVNLNRYLQPVLDGCRQQVFAPGVIRALFKLLLDLTDEIVHEDLLYLQEIKHADDIPN